MAREKRQKPVWYKLDNAAMMYSAIQKENYSAIYRFSAVMTELVDPEALQRAIDKTLPRFPGFRVRIKRGAFWYYFEPNGAPGPFVKEDMKNPCQPVRFGEVMAALRFFTMDTGLAGGLSRSGRRSRVPDAAPHAAGRLSPGAGARHPQHRRGPGHR